MYPTSPRATAGKGLDSQSREEATNRIVQAQASPPAAGPEAGTYIGQGVLVGWWQGGELGFRVVGREAFSQRPELSGAGLGRENMVSERGLAPQPRRAPGKEAARD